MFQIKKKIIENQKKHVYEIEDAHNALVMSQTLIWENLIFDKGLLA